MSTWRYALSDIDLGPEEAAAVRRVLESRWLSAGPEVEAFESEFAAATGARHAIAVSSGTAALHLVLLATVRAGDEVVQPALNFVAMANVTRAVGAVPVFADVASPEDPTISATSVESVVSARSAAVVVMHHSGTPARVGAIGRLCRERGLRLVEDACHAVGSTYGAAAPDLADRHVGAGADAACYSFFSNKNLATGEGGMVTTGDDALAAAVRLSRSHGMTTMTWDRHRGHASTYDVARPGFNYRLDELHAAIGRVQLTKLASNNEARRRALQRYHARLAELAGWIVPFAGDDRPTSGHLATAVAPSRAVRDRVTATLRARGVQTSLHYPAIPSFTAYADSEADVPHSFTYAERAITFPLHPGLAPDDVDVICDEVAAALG